MKILKIRAHIEDLSPIYFSSDPDEWNFAYLYEIIYVVYSAFSYIHAFYDNRLVTQEEKEEIKQVTFSHRRLNPFYLSRSLLI